MQTFTCPTCNQRIWFHNTICQCGQRVVFDPDAQHMHVHGASCRNRSKIGCNWQAETDGLCRSCAMTEMVPDLGAPENVELWGWTEQAKRWILANLARWGWFTPDDPGARPVFRLLSEKTAKGETDVIMGHANGLITINVSEASEATLAKRQEELGELYRTMIGHMRHETAHFLHLRLMQRPDFPAAFRGLFGDERADYGDALKRHYADPQPAGSHYITSYATSHPHEDWAETTAHLLHLVDMLDSAAQAGLTLPGSVPEGYDAYREEDAERVVREAIDVSLAINHVNRALDLADLYPFVIGPGVQDKLGFVHRWLRMPPL
ncbi:zinc-binding metallopeptidase family protein [Mesobacterium pallidum]|uniref:zinc-binding metallopeptidase family protein n=1 Tax=Mesobacterium pallidum TaxID=2872037 RepID=UPI001EE28E1A|nr:putative zinc-binding metallopeptidase [Mesobacterium pallidum]